MLTFLEQASIRVKWSTKNKVFIYCITTSLLPYRGRLQITQLVISASHRTETRSQRCLYLNALYHISLCSYVFLPPSIFNHYSLSLNTLTPNNNNNNNGSSQISDNSHFFILSAVSSNLILSPLYCIYTPFCFLFVNPNCLIPFSTRKTCLQNKYSTNGKLYKPI